LDILREKKRTNSRFVMPEQLLRDTLRKINEALMEGFPVPHPTWKEVCEADELTQKAKEKPQESTQEEEEEDSDTVLIARYNDGDYGLTYEERRKAHAILVERGDMDDFWTSAEECSPVADENTIIEDDGKPCFTEAECEKAYELKVQRRRYEEEDEPESQPERKYMLSPSQKAKIAVQKAKCAKSHPKC
jgi:hypothetical protein